MAKLNCLDPVCGHSEDVHKEHPRRVPKLTTCILPGCKCNGLKLPTPDHKWSGWPGAYCLDCGAEDNREYCPHAHPACPDCKGEGKVRDKQTYQREDCEDCSGTGVKPGGCGNTECQNEPCMEPGSGRCNPYLNQKKESAKSNEPK